MDFSTLTFSGWDWRWPVAALLAAAVGLLLWSYRAAPRGPLRWICPTLKLAALAALAFCLLEPLWSGQRARPGANLVAVVADNSQSLQIRDPGAPRPRGETLRDLVTPASGAWLAGLAENFEVRRYLFDARLHATPDFGELAFDGRASAIGAALNGVAERFRGRPLAGVILLTDGSATDLPGPLPDLAGLPPVYPVVIGGRVPPRDLAVGEVQVSQTAFEDAPVTVQAGISASGFRGDAVVVRLFDAGGRAIEEQVVNARGDGEAANVRFQLKPEQAGVSFYWIEVAPKNQPAAPDGGTDEATPLNNRRWVTVDRGQGPLRVLYVSGRPNWEFKFLNRALDEDSQLDLMALIRVAKREPKFEFRGRAGESGNPLFRGFGTQERAEVERYDQPVLVRLVKPGDELELRGGFPRTPEELYVFHAVIVDDLEAAFFAPDQAALLQRFVSERGGGFLMLGGAESFAEGGYRRTPIGDMLPVYLDPAPATPRAGGARFELAREGWLQAWARLRDNEADERARREAMPAFEVLNRLREVKPGASVVATASATGGDVPALVVQRFGRGRTAALMVGDVWRWGMRDPEARRDMDKAWRQLVRWLVADVPRRVELAAEAQPGDAQGAVRLPVRVRDAAFQPLDDAAVTVDIQPVAATGAGTNSVRLRAEPSTAEPGLYEVAFVPRASGGYRATATVTNAAGAEVGRAEAGWTADPAGAEFRSLVPNIALLEAIARKTGGEVVAAAALEPFVRALPRRSAPVMEPWSTPAWHTPAPFALALACLVAEWGLRRWKGPAVRSALRSADAFVRAARPAASSLLAVLGVSLVLGPCTLRLSAAESADTPTVLLAVGSPGEPEFGTNFLEQAALWEKACAQTGARLLTMGAGESGPGPDLDRLRQAIEAEPREGAAGLWFVLIGHGTFDGKEAKLNLAGPDLSAADLVRWLEPFRRPVVVINTASASAPFLAALAGTNRIVITATRSGHEQNFTRFGGRLAAALADPAGDVDQDGQTSLLEAFLSASRAVAEFYQTEGRLATEHALLDDNGDGLGTPADWFRGVRATKQARDGAAPDGLRAHQVHLLPSPAEQSLPPAVRARRDELELAIARLREEKEGLPEEEYYQRLEVMCLELARLLSGLGTNIEHPTSNAEHRAR